MSRQKAFPCLAWRLAGGGGNSYKGGSDRAMGLWAGGVADGPVIVYHLGTKRPIRNCRQQLPGLTPIFSFPAPPFTLDY